jgi:hypothetical protein
MERVAALLVAPIALGLGDQHLAVQVDTVAR